MKAYKGLIKIYCKLPECLFSKLAIDADCSNCDQSKTAIIGLDEKKLVEIKKDVVAKDRKRRKKVR